MYIYINVYIYIHIYIYIYIICDSGTFLNCISNKATDLTLSIKSELKTLFGGNSSIRNLKSFKYASAYG